MKVALVFSEKDPAEVDDRGLDFSALLTTGETISTATVSVSVWTGTDSSPSSILSGGASTASNIVWQRYTGGVAGTMYRLQYKANTSGARSLIACALLRVETCE